MNRFKAEVYAGERFDRNRMVWKFQIRDDQGRLMAFDSTASWEVTYQEALRTVEAMHILETRGFELTQPVWLIGA